MSVGCDGMQKHYKVFKYIVCELLGESCGEVHPYGKALYPNCKICELYTEWKKSGMSSDEYHEDIRKKLNDWYLNTHE